MHAVVLAHGDSFTHTHTCAHTHMRTHTHTHNEAIDTHVANKWSGDLGVCVTCDECDACDVGDVCDVCDLLVPWVYECFEVYACFDACKDR